MKKTILYAVAAVTAVASSFTAGYEIGRPSDIMMANYNTLEYKTELIQAQDEALMLASKVMWNNNLFEEDYSSDFLNFMEAACKVDSLYSLEM